MHTGTRQDLTVGAGRPKECTGAKVCPGGGGSLFPHLNSSSSCRPRETCAMWFASSLDVASVFVTIERVSLGIALRGGAEKMERKKRVPCILGCRFGGYVGYKGALETVPHAGRAQIPGRLTAS